MLKGRATAEATAAYAKKFPALPGHFRPMLEMSVSSIGIGTYLGDPDAATDRGYEEAIKAALRGGINLIDTAVNYRFQRSERNMCKAIAELVAAGDLTPEEGMGAAKGGSGTLEGGGAADPPGGIAGHFLNA